MNPFIPVTKKPVTVRGAQWDGSIASGETIAEYANGPVQLHAEKNDPRPPRLVVVTKEGVMTAKPGDWIICGVSEEFYPCDADIFARTYNIGG